MKRARWLLMFILSFCGAAAAQSLPWNIPTTQRTAVNQQQAEAWRRTVQNAESQRQFEFMNAISRTGRGEGSVTVSTSSLSLEKQARKYVKPDGVLSNQYRSFLKLPNTGLSLLLPAKVCTTEDGENFDKLIKRCPFNFLAGNGSYFSFRERDYAKSFAADLGVKDNWIFSLGLFNQGILVNLGDVAPESINLSDKGIKFLADFQPALVPAEADRQFKNFEDGLTVDGYLYRQVLPIETDKTYALRVVAYKVAMPYEIGIHGSKRTIFPFVGDDRKDLIVVFRIVRKEADGTLALLWRELARKPAAELMVPANSANDQK